MAVRVIDEKPDPTVVKQVICRNCGVKLEFVPADIKTRIDRDYTGSGDQVRFIDCPKCSDQVTIRY